MEFKTIQPYFAKFNFYSRLVRAEKGSNIAVRVHHTDAANEIDPDLIVVLEDNLVPIVSGGVPCKELTRAWDALLGFRIPNLTQNLGNALSEKARVAFVESWERDQEQAVWIQLTYQPEKANYALICESGSAFWDAKFKDRAKERYADLIADAELAWIEEPDRTCQNFATEYHHLFLLPVQYWKQKTGVELCDWAAEPPKKLCEWCIIDDMFYRYTWVITEEGYIIAPKVEVSKTPYVAEIAEFHQYDKVDPSWLIIQIEANWEIKTSSIKNVDLRVIWEPLYMTELAKSRADLVLRNFSKIFNERYPGQSLHQTWKFVKQIE